MTKVCNRCGAPEGEVVCWKLDGSAMFALDTDLASEFPKVWSIPKIVMIRPNGMCKNCITSLVADIRLATRQHSSQSQED